MDADEERVVADWCLIVAVVVAAQRTNAALSGLGDLRSLFVPTGTQERQEA